MSGLYSSADIDEVLVNKDIMSAAVEADRSGDSAFLQCKCSRLSGPCMADYRLPWDHDVGFALIRVEAESIPDHHVSPAYSWHLTLGSFVRGRRLETALRVQRIEDY